MSVDNSNTNNASSPAVQLFQKAHQNMVLLARVDEQMAQLMQRRKALLDELRAVQGEINDEFHRVIETPGQLASRIAAAAGTAPGALAGAMTNGTGSNGTNLNGSAPFAQRIDEPSLA
jgi:hypothetical protein